MMRHCLVTVIFCYVACVGASPGLALFPIYHFSAQSDSYVRVIHASPFVGTADVFVDGSKLLSSFQFAAVTDYVPVPRGVHRVQIALVGKGINASVITQDLPVGAGFTYTVAALGTKADALSLQVFEDNNQVAPGQVKVRVYQLAPDAGALNVSIGHGNNLSNIPYPSASEYLNADAGSCDFNFNSQQLATNLLLNTTLKANMVTSVFSVGLFSGHPKVQLVLAQTTGVPGLPNTGSDPTLPALATHWPPFIFWLFLAVLFAGVGTIPVIRRARRFGRV